MELIEGGFEAGAFGRTTHDAGVHAGLEREVAEARGGEIPAVGRKKDFLFRRR